MNSFADQRCIQRPSSYEQTLKVILDIFPTD